MDGFWSVVPYRLASNLSVLNWHQKDGSLNIGDKTLLKSLDEKTKTNLTQASNRAGLKHLAAHFG